MESLGNLADYLLSKKDAVLSFGRLILRGPTVTSRAHYMLDLIYLTPLGCANFEKATVFHSLQNRNRFFTNSS